MNLDEAITSSCWWSRIFADMISSYRIDLNEWSSLFNAIARDFRDEVVSDFSSKHADSFKGVLYL